ncbi:MAG: pyridoxal phosphate-dependent aminotransferase [Betaproteobacteria bacterium]
MQARTPGRSTGVTLAGRVRDIAPFQVMEVQTAARALEAAGRSVIHLEIGEPDFPTPQPVIHAARSAIEHGDIYYTSALGLAALREAIAGHYLDAYGVTVDPARVIVTAGASAALLLVVALLVDRDRKVLLTDPAYPCNRHFVRAMEGVPVSIPVGPDSAYQLNADLIREHWDSATVAALVATPSNPTGTIIATAELLQCAGAVREAGGSLIVDEIYQGLSYDGAPSSVLEFDDDSFVLSSFSKYFNMTGWRLGWIVAPLQYVRDLEKLAQNFYISPSAVAQRAALSCFLPETLAILEGRRSEFRERRDFLVPALRELGFRIPVMPAGGFFIYADTSALAADSRDFARDVLQATGVAFTSGDDFGTFRAHDHVRLAYTIAMPKLIEAVARLRKYLRPAA